MHIVPEVIIPISHSGGIILNVDWIVSFNSFNSFSSIAVSIIKKNTGNFDSFKFNLYSIVVEFGNNSTGKFSSDICCAYAGGNIFFVEQKGQTHDFERKSRIKEGARTLLQFLQRTGSYSNNWRFSVFFKGV